MTANGKPLAAVDQAMLEEIERMVYDSKIPTADGRVIQVSGRLLPETRELVISIFSSKPLAQIHVQSLSMKIGNRYRIHSKGAVLHPVDGGIRMDYRLLGPKPSHKGFATMASYSTYDPYALSAALYHFASQYPSVYGLTVGQLTASTSVTAGKLVVLCNPDAMRMAQKMYEVVKTAGKESDDGVTMEDFVEFLSGFDAFLSKFRDQPLQPDDVKNVEKAMSEGDDTPLPNVQVNDTKDAEKLVKPRVEVSGGSPVYRSDTGLTEAKVVASLQRALRHLL